MSVDPQEYCPVCGKVTPSVLRPGLACMEVHCGYCGHHIETMLDDYYDYYDYIEEPAP